MTKTRLIHTFIQNDGKFHILKLTLEEIKQDIDERHNKMFGKSYPDRSEQICLYPTDISKSAKIK